MEFVGYFSQVFEPVALMLLIGGTFGGLVLGATPGLSPTMAVAPVSYTHLRAHETT